MATSKMSDQQSRVLPDFRALGCTDQTKCALATRVMQDQQIDGRVTNLETLFDSDLDLLYVRGLKLDVPTIFVPVLSCHDLDLARVDKIQSKLAHKNGSVTLAICDTSSNILYYKLTRGFVEQK